MRICLTAALTASLVLGASCRHRSDTDVPPSVPANAGKAAGTRADSRPDTKAPLSYVTVLTGEASASDRLPTIVAAHGLGDNARSFSRFFHGFEHPARFLVVQAPTAYGDGYSWFSIRMGGESGTEGGTIEDAAHRLADFVAYADSNFSILGKAIITGFSQGGILSFAVAALHPETIDAAFPIAGTMTHELRALATERSAELPPIVAFHGAIDPLIGVGQTRLAVNALVRAGADAELHVYEDVGHSISPELSRDYFRLLGRRISETSASRERLPAHAAGVSP